MKIVELREGAGLKQYELAKAAGIDPGTLSRIEAGKSQGSTAAMRRLARALGVPFEALFDEEAAAS